MRMDKSKENTLMNIHMYIYIHPLTHKLIKYRYTCAHIHFTYYSSQVVLFDIKFESIGTFRFFNLIRKAVPNRGTNIRNCFSSDVCLAKTIFKFRKGISSAYPTMLGEFKSFIPIIRTSAIDKIAGYSMH